MFSCRFFKGKTPYAISKIGMTILTNGLGYELRKSGQFVLFFQLQGCMFFCTYVHIFVLDQQYDFLTGCFVEILTGKYMP